MTTTEKIFLGIAILAIVYYLIIIAFWWWWKRNIKE